MPEQELYKKGFNLYQGLILNGYELINIEIGHQQIKRYKKYSYPSKLTWRIHDNSYNRNGLITNLNEYLKNTRIINSAYGNPYSCNFGVLNYQDLPDGSIIATATGECIRI